MTSINLKSTLTFLYTLKSTLINLNSSTLSKIPNSREIIYTFRRKFNNRNSYKIINRFLLDRHLFPFKIIVSNS